ncbi:unnamed protein product [Rhizoctonia solani]|uniref:Protein kinase domain-containing protein n=1 Tax=Rhizoctonia solani TaxID=456999 RepID=A0A8H2Y599_9AGAM|nr:unnamed protein product [Rhizoctonia solani]
MSQPGSSASRPGPIVYKGHAGPVRSVAFSPDGKSVVSGSWDRTIRMWEAHSPSPIGHPLQGHTDTIWSVSYSPLGNMIASASKDRTIRLWDTMTRQLVGDPLYGHVNTVASVAFSHGGDLVASGSTDKTVRLWDVQRRVAVSRPFKGHTNWVRSVAFSPDSTRIVSGSYDETIRVWDVERGIIRVGPLEGHTSVVRSVAYSPDGSQIVSGSYDRTLRLWDSRTGGIIGNPYEGHTSEVYSVSFSPNGIYIASGSIDRTVRVWDVRTGRQLDEPYSQHTDAVRSVAFSPCGRRIASGSDDKTAIIWSLSDSDSVLEDNSRLEVETPMDIIQEHMSIQDMFELLSSHGCVNLASQMDVNQDNAVLMSGGGFGDVWKGELLSGKKVAIKVWRASLIEQCDYKSLKRATREIYYWSKMKHDNIHQLMGVIMFKNLSLGMISEWMENGNLHEYLRKNPSANRYQLSVDVGSGLAYIHDHNMVHGDIKALNVLVSSSGAATLTDFGLSTMSESSIAFSATSTSQAGSIRWAAPELLLEQSSKSKESDIYALGMLVSISAVVV